jgi:hypothetical protein
MNAEKALFAMMKAHAPLTAQIPSARMYPSVIPLNATLPALSYSLISDLEQTAVGLTTIKNRARVQVTIAVKGVTATEYGQAKALLKLVEDACNHRQGTYNGVYVDSCIKELVGPDLRDDEAGITYQVIDFRIAY